MLTFVHVVGWYGVLPAILFFSIVGLLVPFALPKFTVWQTIDYCARAWITALILAFAFVVLEGWL